MLLPEKMRRGRRYHPVATRRRRYFRPVASEFGINCMRNLSGIMRFQTVLQIFREAHVKMFPAAFALQDIDVEEFHSFRLAGLPGRSSEHIG